MQFKVGDRVVLDNMKDPWGGFHQVNKSNTVGNKGIVTKVYDNCLLEYLVTWDNHTINGYKGINLRHMEIVNV